NRRVSATTLEARATSAGLGAARVTYDDDRGVVVTRAGVRLVVGRYQVVYAWLDGFAAGLSAIPYQDDPRLYEAARKACHDCGLPWTDPRTGITWDPP